MMGWKPNHHTMLQWQGFVPMALLLAGFEEIEREERYAISQQMKHQEDIVTHSQLFGTCVLIM